ncbi:MAG TPA: glycoside hydrolase family 13 protein [Clostridiales bacterium]|nr:glycoside hydrolase family 13 protein [Clostridiales bacterium]
MKKIYDSWDSSYKSSFGAMKTGQCCDFSIRIPHDMNLDFAPVMVIFRTGFKERFLTMTETAVESDCTVYTTSFVPKHTGIHYYYFAMTIDGTRKFIKSVSKHNAILDGDSLFQLTVYADDFVTPDFLKGGVMYQIFPDRFCKSGKEHENVPNDRIIRNDWDGIPYYRPDQNGHVWNNDYFGGDLEGIRSKLPYLLELGVTCIYLTPIFEAHENHRYNTADYMKVDPMLGTNDEFKRLCSHAAEMGIDIIIDGVFSHTGADSIYFNKFNRYDTVGAYNSQDSEYSSWYSFEEFPNKYESWWGIDTLPNVNENDKNYTEYICDDGGVLDYWIEQGVSGYRLDVADELPDKFLDNLNKCVKKHGNSKLIIGEVWEDASNKESYGVKRRYLLGSQLDSVMNYPFRDAILNYVKGGSVFDFRIQVMSILENYPKPAVDVLMNFVSTHDTERAINNFGGESCVGKTKDWMAERRLTDYEYNLGKARLKCAMVLQFFLPGVPCVYYGDESGMQGYKDPFNRQCYNWGHEDKELIDFTKKLIEIRKSSKVFLDGKLIFLTLDENVLVFARARSERQKAVVIFLNRSDSVQTITRDKLIISKYKRFDMLHGDHKDEIEDDLIVLPPYGYAAVKVEL